MKRTTLLLLSLAVGMMVAARVATAQEPVDQPAKLILIQDEDKELSRVQTVFYSAEREASIELLVMGAVEMGRDATMVTIISPNGAADQYSSDGPSLVKINDVEPGLHAIVASSESAHGTTMVNFQPREKADLVDPADALGKEIEPTPPGRMTLLAIKRGDLRPFVERIRDLKSDPAETEFVDLASARESFNYRVALSADGTLTGRVYSVVRKPATVSLDGTRVGIFKDGNLVESTTCDEKGDWKIPNFGPGIYGLIAAGPAGYAAFAFTAAEGAEIAIADPQGQQLISKIQPRPELLPDVLPVVLVPPSMCTAVVKSITESYPGLLRRGVTQSPPGAPLGVPVGGTMVGTTPVGTGGAITGSTGTTAGISEIGGITGLVGTAALIQAAGQQGSGQGLQTPPIASPSIPGN